MDLLTEERLRAVDQVALSVLPELYKDYAECARQHGWDEAWPEGLAKDAFRIATAFMKERKNHE